MSATTAQQFVLDAVQGAGFPAPFKELILLALSQPGRILDRQHTSLFHDIVTACCSATDGRADLAPRAAAAFELCIAASDILDEIEDGDESIVCSRGGMPRALNASTSLLALSFGTLVVPDVAEADKALCFTLSRSLAATILDATIGQDADLSDAASDVVSIETAIAIARGKSGRLVAGACELGAMLAGCDEETLNLYREYGAHLGTAYQLNNDLRDASTTAKSDTRHVKMTVPLAFHLKNGSCNSDEITREALRASGALQFTSVLIETERLACFHVADTLESRGHNVAPLRELLVVQ